VIVFPTREGRFYEYENLRMTEVLTHFLPNLTCAQRLAHLRNMDVVLTIGESDPFRGNNEYLRRILHGKGVPHQLHIWEDRAHSAHYWRRMARIYV
jgi:esterase/lipase superfamily enzyme